MYDPNLLPPAIQESTAHPAADVYVVHLREVQLAIVKQSLSMDKKLVAAAKDHHRGIPVSESIINVGRTATWIAKNLKTVPALRLIALLAYYQEAIDGPDEAQRRAMLWRISVNNETAQPKVSISAIGEMNKMENIGKEALNALTSGDINIVINNNLSRTALDE